MAESYPRRNQARGLWKINDITKNIKEEGTYPGAAGFIALCGGGYTGDFSNVIDEFNMITAGNATDFGDLITARSGCSTNSSNIRILWSGGETGSNHAEQDYVHFATKGNAADFGDLTTAQGNTTKGTGNEVKAVTSSGSGDSDLLNTFIFSSLGSSTSFGNLTAGRNGAPQGTTNGVRGTYSGGMAPNQSDVIDFIEISTDGNATDFGDLSVARGEASSADSKTRSVIFSGRTNTPSSGTIADVIDSFETASQGNAVNFGDMNVPRKGMAGGLSNSIKGFSAGGTASPGNTNSIEQVTIASAGNGSDFGDLSVTRSACPGNTSSHGGINVFHPRPPELYSPTEKPLASGGGIGDIGMYHGGGPATNIDVIQISTLGNSTQFGDLITATQYTGSCADATRYVAGGKEGANFIEYVTFSTKGNAANFGDFPGNGERGNASSNNNTRGIFQGGYEPSPGLFNECAYITIQTLGDTTDFGDLTVTRGSTTGCQSTTRGLAIGGATVSATTTVDYCTIASTGNYIDFGDCTTAVKELGSTSSTTRAVKFGGRTESSPNNTNEMDYFTIASTGNATDFGNLAAAARGTSGVSNQTRGVCMGGGTPSAINTIQYITIASTGDTADFGDMYRTASAGSSKSNGHSGLS